MPSDIYFGNSTGERKSILSEGRYLESSANILTIEYYDSELFTRSDDFLVNNSGNDYLSTFVFVGRYDKKESDSFFKNNYQIFSVFVTCTQGSTADEKCAALGYYVYRSYEGKVMYRAWNSGKIYKPCAILVSDAVCIPDGSKLSFEMVGTVGSSAKFTGYVEGLM